MAPRFAFRASKFRNIECKPASRDASYDQLQVTNAAVEGNAVTATVDRFAFAHQIDGGAAIQVKALRDTGKDTAAIPPLLRGHSARVNTLQFSPFHPAVLLSGSADTTVKVWKLHDDPDMSEIQSSCATIVDATSSLVDVKWHTSAADIAAAASHREVLVLDLTSDSVAFRTVSEDTNGDTFTGLSWNYDGSLLLNSSSNQHVRIYDPRMPAGTTVDDFKAHSGRRRPTSIVWCGRHDLFITSGCDPMQDRELKLWDPRDLTKAVARERLDSSIGQLFPLYDTDLDLVYVLGKGDRSVRAYEVDNAGMHKLSQTLVPHMTHAAGLVPKQAYNTRECEVARVLNLSVNGGSTGGICDVLSFTVPRKDAFSEFQQDLYPDTLARSAALGAEEWINGQNAVPILEKVSPTPETSVSNDGRGLNLVFGSQASGSSPAPSSWSSSFPSQGVNTTPTNAAWGEPAASTWGGGVASAWGSSGTTPEKSTTTSSASGWGSKTTAWNAPAPSPISSTAPPARPIQWFTPRVEDTKSADSPPQESTVAALSSTPVPEKIARFTSSQGHRLKYIKGKQSTRNDALNLGDKVATSNCIKSNGKYVATPVMGAGGPVLVTLLGAYGRVSTDDLVLDGHKATVTDVAFHPFDSEILATGSGDSTISIWKLDQEQKSSPLHQLRGHTKGIKSLEFHPRAADVLCSTSQDLSIRLWDVEVGTERVCFTGKLEEPVWNAAFNPDGSLFATSSRARLVRVFDPRATTANTMVALGCGFDSIRPQYVQWLSPTHLITLGTTGAPRHETQLRIWDARSLVDPLSTTTIDSSAAESYPFYDASSHVLFLAGTGGRHIWSYEIVDTTTVHANLPFIADGLQTISAATLLPKRLCDLRSVEIDRLLLLRGNAIESVSFTLPRNEKLRQYFQDDVYGDVPVNTPSLSAAQWFNGDEVVVQYETLRPSEMTPLSEKPEELNKPIPMSQQFRAKWEAEEREKKLKAENLQRLQALAKQPTLHANASRRRDESDEEWDD